MRNILLIDDGKETQLLVYNVLKNKRVDLSIASNASEGLKLVEKKNFDLILLDVKLPDKDGFEIYLNLMKDEKTKQIPIIFLTGVDSPTDKFVAMALGAGDY